MNALYEVTDVLLAGQALGCIAGLAASVLLIVLLRASWSFPAQRRPGVLLAVALVVWNLGGLANAALIIGGFDYQSGPAKVACAVGYTGLTVLTWAVLGVWRLCCKKPWQKHVNSALQIVAVVAGFGIAVWLWREALGFSAPLTRTGIRIAAEACLYAMVLPCVAVALFDRPSSPTRFAAALTGVAAVGPLAAVALLPVYGSLPQAVRAALSVGAEQSVNFIVIAAFILLARLRFTDILIERLLQCVGALALGLALWYAAAGPLDRLMRGATAYPRAGLAVMLATLSAALLLMFPAATRTCRRFVERLFQQADFESALRSFASAIAPMSGEQEVLRRLESAISEALESPPAAVRAQATTGALTLLLADDILEFQPGSHLCLSRYGIDADLLIPIRLNGRLAHIIGISRTPEWRGLLDAESRFLRNLGHAAAARLETLRLEQERSERERREAALLHQTAEAELRALRAQINPHFLFNSLNTIADLIVVDARKAERMTERLSDVFRYVLLHSQSQTITVEEEMDFIRRYLDIEEARFGDRLKVRFAVDPATASLKVPALILQPVVENAIKHGLAPKIEGGALAISSSCEGGDLRLVVEDDGVGLAANGHGKSESAGVGLSNTSERLRTLYGDRAALTLESPRQRGCRVTIRIPRGDACGL